MNQATAKSYLDHYLSQREQERKNRLEREDPHREGFSSLFRGLFSGKGGSRPSLKDKEAQKRQAEAKARFSEPATESRTDALSLVMEGVPSDAVLQALVEEGDSDEDAADLLKYDTLPGGRADNPSGKFLQWLRSREGNNRLEQGIRHEREHTSSRQKAAEIAADHLKEDPQYYSHIKAVEKQEKKGEKKRGADAPSQEN